jgi:hypothetical protein
VRIAAAHRRDRAICQLVREQVDDLIAETADLRVRQPSGSRSTSLTRLRASVGEPTHGGIEAVRVRAPELADRMCSVRVAELTRERNAVFGSATAEQP